MVKQRTLKSSVSVTGVGLHSGEKVTLGLRPAPANTGIVFRRVDVKPVEEIRARADLVHDTRLSTCMEQNGVRVATIEHLMSAFAGLGVDNVYVDMDSPEVPIMDGSAGTFIFLLQSTGIVEQTAAKKFVRVLKPVEVKQGDKWVRFEPYNGYKLTFTINFAHPVFANTRQHVTVDLGEESYIRDISRARRAERIEFALITLGEPGEPPGLSQRADAIATPSDYLMGISLMPDVPDQPVSRRIEDPVQRHRQLDDAEPGTKMPARHRDRVDHFQA